MNKNASDILTPAEIDEYWNKGYQKLNFSFSRQETRTWQEECDRLWQSASINSDDSSIQWRGHIDQQRIADRFDPVLERSPVFRKLAEDKRILRILRALFGNDAGLMKDKLITKRPGTKGYGMHQDYAYWTFMEIPADEIVSIQISIDAANEANGALEVFPNLHHTILPGPPDEPRDVDETKVDLSTGEIIDTEPGDVLLLHSLTPHRSGPNRSSDNRRMLYLSYTCSEERSVRRRYYKMRDKVS